jgi:hypothetical protein
MPSQTLREIELPAPPSRTVVTVRVGATIVGARFDVTPRSALAARPIPRGVVVCVAERDDVVDYSERVVVLALPGNSVPCEDAAELRPVGSVHGTNAYLLEVVPRALSRVQREELIHPPVRDRIVELDRCGYCGRTLLACDADACVGSSTHEAQ